MCEVYLHQIICRLSYPCPSPRPGERDRAAYRVGMGGGRAASVGVEPFVLRLRRRRPYLKEGSSGGYSHFSLSRTLSLSRPKEPGVDRGEWSAVELPLLRDS